MQFSKMKVKEIDTYLNELSIDHLLQMIEFLQQDSRSSVQKLAIKYQKKADRHFEEIARIKRMWRFEDDLFNDGIQYVAGVDEAGRGPLAGPVFAASVILPRGIFIEGINDSKKINEKKRDELYDIIIEKAICYEIASVDEQEIDRINIRNAAFKAMVKAVNRMKTKPQHVLVDGDDVKGLTFPYTTIIKGDSLSVSIAAASILAKVARDRYIKELDQLYPQYGFANHKGYGTKEHIEAIKLYGLTPIHRGSFTKKFVV